MPGNSGGKSSNPEKDAKGSDVKSKGVARRIWSVIYYVRRSGQLLTNLNGKDVQWPTKLLFGWLHREATGNNADWRSPIFGKFSREEIIARWDKIYNQGIMADDTMDDQSKVLLTQMESGQRANISVQSAYLPWSQDGPEKVKAIYSDKPKKPELVEEALVKALTKVQALLPSGVLKMQSLENAINASRNNAHAIDEPGLDISTNAGPPTFNRHWWPSSGQPKLARLRSEVSKAIILSRAKKAIEISKAGDSPSWWAIVAKRLAQKKDPMKRKRIVIALEKAEAVLWKTFTPQLMDLLRKVVTKSGVRTFVAWVGLPAIDLDMQKMLKHAADSKRTVLSGDLSSFDATIPPWLMESMGEVISTWMSPEASYLPKALCRSLAYKVSLITPDHIYGEQPSSMKSGSGGTNLLDSLINLVALYYGEALGWYVVDSVCVQGDDFVIDGEGIAPEAIANAFSHFGMIAHPDKQLFQPNALSFLQRLHILGRMGGISSTYRTLGSILSYERLRYKKTEWNGWVDVVRTLSQLENVVFNPLFMTFIKFVKGGDKFELGATISPSRVLALSGDVGKDTIQRDVGAAWKSSSSINGFSRMLVNRALRGESLPPQGGNAYFLCAYGDDRVSRAGGMKVA